MMPDCPQKKPVSVYITQTEYDNVYSYTPTKPGYH